MLTSCEANDTKYYSTTATSTVLSSTPSLRVYMSIIVENTGSGLRLFSGSTRESNVVLVRS